MKRIGATHWIWPIGGQVVTRGLAGVKFFALAKILGPEGLGTIAAFLLLIAIFEALSDSGILAAIVHGDKSVDESQRFMIFVANIFRGVILFLISLASREFVFDYFKGALSLKIIGLVGVVFLIKSLINPAYYVLHRERQFKTIFFIDGFYVIFDFLFALVFLFRTNDIVYVIYALMLSELFKVILSWMALDRKIKIGWNPAGVKKYYSYGRWVWAGSFFTFGLNQLDKILVAKYFGLELFGIYQFSAKLAQMAIADLFTTLTSYVFPLLATANRNGISDFRDAWRKWLKIYFVGLCLVSCIFQLFLSEFIEIFFGGKWNDSIGLIRAFNIPMFFGGLIAVSVVAIRAIGEPKRVFYSTILQIALLILIVVPAANEFGLIGVVLALGIAGAASFLYIFYRIKVLLKCRHQS